MDDKPADYILAKVCRKTIFSKRPNILFSNRLCRNFFCVFLLEINANRDRKSYTNKMNDSIIVLEVKIERVWNSPK
jgi:hypothetical protein